MRAITGAIMALTMAGAAQAQTVGVTSAAADFFNPVVQPTVGVGAQVPVELLNLDGLAGNEVIRYGNPVGGTVRNSMTFASSAGQSVSVGDSFALGTLTINNVPAYYPLTAVSLSIVSSLTFNGASISAGPFLFQLALENTPNGFPCAYPSTTPCADRLTIATQPAPASFTIDGQVLTLFIDGFDDADGVRSSAFVVQEGGASTATLIGRFGLASTAVPEPATWATMIAGFGLVGGALLRRRPALTA